MIKIENVEVMGWEAAIRGMRNPMNSWEKSDSVFCHADGGVYNLEGRFEGEYLQNYGFDIGEKDLNLMTRLRNAGTDHRKFMRMITVYFDITAPLYWWKEFDTYKVGTVANSCSTMHKIADKKFTLEDFSCEHLLDEPVYFRGGFDSNETRTFPRELMLNIIATLNICRDAYLKTKDKKYWWQMIQLLPSSYNQRRTVMLNYEVLANIYKSRYNHKLDEWHDFCSLIEGLDYSELITADIVNKKGENRNV